MDSAEAVPCESLVGKLLHGSDRRAQKDAAVALTRAALTEDGIRDCVQAEVPTALVQLLQEGDGQEQELAAWALVNMASSEEGSSSCVIAGAPTALVVALLNPCLKPAAKEKAANAITNIAMSESGANACANAECCEALVEVMQRKSSVSCRSCIDCVRIAEEDISAVGLEACASAVANIAYADDARQACVEAGCTEALVGLLRGDHRSAKEAAARALANVTLSEDGAHTCVMADGEAVPASFCAYDIPPSCRCCSSQ